MEKKQVGGAYRLIVIMIFFVVSMFFLNQHKRSGIIATHIDISGETVHSVAEFSLDQAYQHMYSLFKSHNIDLIIKVINQCMHQFTCELVEKIIIDSTFLFSPEEKMRIIFGTILHCNGKKSIQHRLLNFLITYPELHKTVPVLLVLMRSSAVDILPVFTNWARSLHKNDQKEDLMSLFVNDALVAAIDQDDYDIVESMFSKKIKISYEKASQLLWYIVENNKNNKFVSLLVRHAQANVNSIDNGRTLLIVAVEQNNKKMIQSLLDEGAVVDRIVDPAKGTALQIAMALNNIGIQELLREYGA